MVDGQMLLGVVQEPRAQAHPVFTVFQDAEVAAAFAALPELGVVRELGERHGTEAELVVHLHHRRAGGDGEDLGIGEELPGQDEGLFLDLLREAYPAELVRDDEAGVRDEALAAPGLYIGEAGELAVLGEGDHGLARAYFFINVFRGPICDTRFPLQGGDVNLLTDGLCKGCVALLGHHNLEFHKRVRCTNRGQN